MSRLSNSRVRLCWSPATGSATLRHGWVRRRAVAAANWAAGAGSAPARRETLAGLLAELGRNSALAGAALEVELADDQFYFDVAVGDFADRSHAELGLVARAYAAEVLGHGDAVDLRWSLQTDERHLVICGLAHEIRDELLALAAANALRLRSVSPAFQRAWNRHAPRTSTGLAVMASLGSSCATIALCQGGTIKALESLRWPGLLDGAVDRLLASLGLSARQVSHFLAAGGAEAVDLADRWTLCDRAERAS